MNPILTEQYLHGPKHVATRFVLLALLVLVIVLLLIIVGEGPAG